MAVVRLYKTERLFAGQDGDPRVESWIYVSSCDLVGDIFRLEFPFDVGVFSRGGHWWGGLGVVVSPHGKSAISVDQPLNC